MHFCSPRFVHLLNLLVRNDAYIKAVEDKRRPLVYLTSLVWSWSKYHESCVLTSYGGSKEEACLRHASMWATS